MGNDLNPTDDIEMDTVTVLSDEAVERLLLWMGDMGKQGRFIEPKEFMNARGLSRYKALSAPPAPGG